MAAAGSSEEKLKSLEQVLNVDASFAAHRPHLRPQDDEETLYAKWRKLLLYRQMTANRILVNTEGDRRADYLFAREQLLSTRFPARNRSRRPQEGYDYHMKSSFTTRVGMQGSKGPICFSHPALVSLLRSILTPYSSLGIQLLNLNQ
jgi:hypothetical protein